MLSESQWDRYSALLQRLKGLPAGQRENVLRAMRAQPEEDPSVLHYVSVYFRLPPEPDRCRTGERIGQFTLGAQLGSGGMGVVYHAQEDPPLERDVALKLIHPKLILTGQSDAVERFQDEIEQLAKFELEGIARIYTAGTHTEPQTGDTIPFFAMQLVRGGVPITVYAKEHALTVPERLWLFLRVCEAVRAAHQQLVIHRDLKPTNILVDHAGRPFVIDFGLAQICDSFRYRGGECIAGTPPYMSPEQVSDVFGPVEPISDVYTLGFILYELLAGRRPIEVPPNASWVALHQAILTTIPAPLSRYNAECRGDLETIVAKALAKRPADRYSSVADLHRVIDNYLAWVKRVELERAVRPKMAPRGGSETDDAGGDIIDCTPAQTRSPQIALDRRRQERSQDRQHPLEVKREAIVGVRLAVDNFFTDREDKLAELRQVLADRTTKLICITGRAGIGKTALLAKICAEIESGELRLSKSTVHAGVEGILYMSCRDTDKPPVGRLFEREVGVGKWLGSPQAEELMDCWRDPSHSFADKTRFLLSSLRTGDYLHVLDNVEDMLGPDDTFADPEWRMFVDVCLASQHGLRLLATSHAPVVVDGQVVHAVRTVRLDAGLPEAEAVTLLRALDPAGERRLRDASAALLSEIVERCAGIPYALHTVAGILVQSADSGDDPTRTLTQLLADADVFNTQVGEKLLAEHHRRVSDAQRRVLQALAIFGKPVPATAVRYQVAGFFPDIDVASCLRMLVRHSLVTPPREHDTYELLPLNQHYVYARIPDTGDSYTKSAGHRRAAKFYAECRKPRGAWRAMTDVQPQRDEIYHLMAAQEYDAACTILADIDAYLMAWGDYREVAELRSQLMLKLSEHWEAANATALAECLYQGLDQWDEALQHVRRVEDSYEKHLNELALAEAVQLHAHILFERGEFEAAKARAQENLQRYERSGTPAQQANAYNSLGVFVDAVGSWPEAVEYYEKAQTLFEALGNAPEKGRVLINRSVAEFFLSGAAGALEVCQRGLALCPQQERPQEFAYGMLNMAVYYLAAGQWQDAESALAECTPWAAREPWFLLQLKATQSMLYCFQERYPEALVLVDEVLGPFQDLEDNWGEIDHSISRGCILSNLGKHNEAMEAWGKALVTAQTKNYFLGTRISAYLLSINNRADTLPADVAAWSREFEQLYLQHFDTVFMPCYVLSLRTKPIIR